MIQEPLPSTPQSAPMQQTVHVALPQSGPYVTYSIIGVTVFIYILQLISVAVFGRSSGGIDLLEIFGAMINSAVRAGELWRLITPVLLHDNQSLAHIMFNMYGLYIFGTFLEQHFGHKRFLLVYLIGAFSGNVMDFVFSSVNSFGIGASTSIFALIGAEGIFFYQNRKLFANQFKRAIGNAVFIVAANLLTGSSLGSGNWGHIGGLVGGLMFTSFAGPVWEIEGISPNYHLVDNHSSREVIIGAATILFIFGGLAIWGLVR